MQEQIDTVGADEWFTPLFLLKRVREFYGDFLDPASSDLVAPYVGATSYYTKKNDALHREWEGKIWLNPPYSKGNINQFTEKLLLEYERGNITEALLLVNSCTETKWFQKIAQKCLLRIDIKGRLHFWHPDKKSDSPRYGQSLFYLSPQYEISKDKEPKFSLINKGRFLETFGDLGVATQVIISDKLLCRPT